MEAVQRRTPAAGTKKESRNRKRRRRAARAALWSILAVWAVLGMIGIITVVQWTLAAGTQARVYGRTPQRPAQAQEAQTSGSAVSNAGRNSGGDPESDRDGWDISAYGSGTSGRPAAEMKALTPEGRAECRRLYEEHPELLVIANKEQELPPDYSPRLRYICNGRLQAADVMYSDLCAMLEAAGDAGFDYWIASGYRSRQRQQELVNEDVRAFMRSGMSYSEALERTLEETMPPGHSEHETGLSLDILCSGNMDMNAAQADEPGNRWLVEHCSEFGFILRYPSDREAVTGIAFEPWHFRYVGREAAQFMAEQELTLEEFRANLSNEL